MIYEWMFMTFPFHHCHLPALLQHIDGDITTNIWTNKFNIWTIIFNATSLLYCNISTVISPQGAETFRRKKSWCAKNSGWRKRHRGSWSVQSCSHHKNTKYQWNWSPKNIQDRKHKNYKKQPNKQTARPPHPSDVPDRSSLTEGHYGAGSEMLIGQSSRKWQLARWQRATPLLPANWQLAKWQTLKVPDPGHFW